MHNQWSSTLYLCYSTSSESRCFCTVFITADDLAPQPKVVMSNTTMNTPSTPTCLPNAYIPDTPSDYRVEPTPTFTTFADMPVFTQPCRRSQEVASARTGSQNGVHPACARKHASPSSPESVTPLAFPSSGHVATIRRHLIHNPISPLGLTRDELTCGTTRMQTDLPDGIAPGSFFSLPIRSSDQKLGELGFARSSPNVEINEEDRNAV